MQDINEEVALLIAQVGPLNGQRWTLRSKLVIGRDFSCDIVIPDRQVSRQHASLTPTPLGTRLEDLGSKNGTHLNGQPVLEATYLADGDQIQIAVAQKFTFLSSDATVPLEDIEETNLTPTPTHSSLMDHPSTEVNRLQLDKRARRIWVNLPETTAVAPKRYRTVEVLPPLSAPQFRLLELLYDSGDQVVTRQDLILVVWGDTQAIAVSEQALDALIRRLRERLASIDPRHEYIVTVRGHGLRLDNPRIAA